MNLPNFIKYIREIKEHDKITDNFTKYLHQYHNQSGT